MVAIGLSANAVARIRFAVSCLWEVVASVRVLRHPSGHVVHVPWVDKVRPRLVDAGLMEGLLWRLIPAEPRYLPDFLTPPPDGLTPDLDTELAVLRATPPEVVRAHLDLYEDVHTGVVQDLYADPEAGLRRLADEITEYWRIAIAADWPRIRVLLGAEVHSRSRVLAENGAAVLLDNLHQRVRWRGDGLSITQPYCSAADAPHGGGIVLIPSVFVWPSVLSVWTGDSPQLAFPAQGAATLWEGPARASEALSAVIGRGRAQLLVEMRAPVSTTELARRTGMSASGVSQHLAALRAAGLVTAHRDGKAILNTRTTVAEALLAAAVC
ncbi:ArsR/SmtB family transcription factor [Actinophytocola sp.]|uniref:ArsR/SmtB family transcription factor n=1 Tax=Actinophytocola sp. TaxID=1872138 RepID=UPI002ECFB315